MCYGGFQSGAPLNHPSHWTIFVNPRPSAVWPSAERRERSPGVSIVMGVAQSSFTSWKIMENLSTNAQKLMVYFMEAPCIHG